MTPVASRRHVASRERGRRVDLFRLFGWLVCLVVSLLILYPLVLVVLNTFGLGASESMAGEVWREATSARGLKILLTTVAMVVPAGLVAMLIAALFAWLNERTDARIGLLADITPLVPMFIPPIAAAIGWVLLAAPNSGLLNGWIEGFMGLLGVTVDGPFNIFTWQGLFIVYVLDLVPFAYITMAAGFRNLDPAAEEAARMSGAGPLETFRRVVLPSLGPSVGGALLITMSIGFGLVSTPVVIGTGARIDVLSVEVVKAMTNTFPAKETRALGYGLLLLLLVTATWLVQRRIVARGGFATVGGKGLKSNGTQLGRWRWPARIVMLGYLVVACLLPIIALVIVSLQGFWSGSMQWSAMTLDNYRNVFANPFLSKSLGNSVIIAAVCATVAVALAAVIARMIHGERGRWATIVEAITRIPAAVPILVFSLAFIAAFVGQPFMLAGTLVLLVIAYVAIFFPHAAVNVSSAYLQVGPQLREAGQVFGISEGRAFLRVLLPLMFPGITAAWAFFFVLVAGDVTIASMLAGPGNPVAGFMILDLYRNGTYPQLGALSVVTTVLTTVVITVALVLARWQRNRISR
jgi:iron(III) transport system permease protein